MRKKNCVNERFCERRISEVLDLKFSKLYQVVIWVPYYDLAKECMRRASHFSYDSGKIAFWPIFKVLYRPRRALSQNCSKSGNFPLCIK